MYVRPEELPVRFEPTVVTQQAPDPETKELVRNKQGGRVARRLGHIACALMSGIFLSGDAHLPDEILLQHNDKPPIEAHDITIMTANVRSWDGPKGDNFDQVLTVLENEDVDIACMQEVTHESDNLSRLYQAGYDVYFAKTVHWPWRAPFGNALVSRAPLDAAESVSLPNPKTIPPRNAILGEIATSHGSLSVTNTHLSTNLDESTLQTRNLFSMVEDSVDLYCGDFNQSADMVVAGPLGGMSNPMFFSANINTFPATPGRTPDREIDFIFSPCGDPASGSERTADIQSDHLARIVRIDFTECFDS